MADFVHRTILITGGGRGIGAATARLFARGGDRVVVTSRTATELAEVVSEIEAEACPGAAYAIPGDVSDEAFVARLFAESAARFGEIDVLVNNAAVFLGGDFSELSATDWDRAVAVNVRGPFLCAREMFRRARAAGRAGSIVNLSSLGGVRGTEKFKGTTSYVTTKFAVTGLTEALAVEGRALGIRVNCVAPGAVDTRMLREAAPFLKTRTTPADIAEIIHYLSDEDRAGSLTGAVIEVQSNL